MDFACNTLRRHLQIDKVDVPRQKKIPRPANAFMLYANENRKKMARSFPLDSNKEISKRLGKGWNELDQEQKDLYYSMAKKVDAEHKKKYPDYVYNPKEARIRKAMRDASRERAMGVAPSRGGRRSQPWAMPEPEEQFMMTPSHGMRSVIGSPMCGTGFPIGNAGSGQFMQPMHSYNKHMHLMPHESNGYLQPNPMAQLQHHADMWHQYHQSPSPMRSNQTEFMLPPSQMPTYHHQQHSPEMNSALSAEVAVLTSAEKLKVETDCFSGAENSQSPHTNENVPPNRNELKLSMTEQAFESKAVEPLMESANLQQSEPFLPVYQENILVQNPFDKAENLKMKKISSMQNNTNIRPRKSLPDFNEAFGSTERGRFQSPPDPRLPPKQGYLDYFFANSDLKFDDYHI